MTNKKRTRIPVYTGIIAALIYQTDMSISCATVDLDRDYRSTKEASHLVRCSDQDTRNQGIEVVEITSDKETGSHIEKRWQMMPTTYDRFLEQSFRENPVCMTLRFPIEFSCDGKKVPLQMTSMSNKQNTIEALMGYTGVVHSFKFRQGDNNLGPLVYEIDDTAALLTATFVNIGYLLTELNTNSHKRALIENGLYL